MNNYMSNPGYQNYYGGNPNNNYPPNNFSKNNYPPNYPNPTAYSQPNVANYGGPGANFGGGYSAGGPQFYPPQFSNPNFKQYYPNMKMPPGGGPSANGNGAN